jgi:membrane associated rhomboid family serine protease
MSKLGFNLIYNFEIGNDIERERGKYYIIQNKYINKYSLSILVCSICTFNLSTSSQQYLNSN